MITLTAGTTIGYRRDRSRAELDGGSTSKGLDEVPSYPAVQTRHRVARTLMNVYPAGHML
jgi:hypothetical protein